MPHFYLTPDGFNTLFWHIVYQLDATVLEASVTYALEVQRCLHGCIAYHTRPAGKVLTVEMQSFDEEEGVVEAHGCKASRVTLHVLMEVPAIFQLEA